MRRKVLVVDDSDILIAWLRSQLEGVGYDVVAASSPVDAAALVLQDRPVAIIIDMVMPNADCGEVIRRVRVNDPKHAIPVILYSGQPLRRLQEAVVRYGVNGCAPKKRDVSELLAEIERVIFGERPAIIAPVTPSITTPSYSQCLFVDDDASILRGYQRVFGSKIDAAFVTSPLDALGRLHAANRPSLVVADIVMPGMSGLDLYARAVSLDETWRSRFVFVTGSDRWKNAGLEWNVPVLQKPVQMQQLSEIIAERS